MTNKVTTSLQATPSYNAFLSLSPGNRYLYSSSASNSTPSLQQAAIENDKYLPIVTQDCVYSWSKNTNERTVIICFPPAEQYLASKYPILWLIWSCFFLTKFRGLTGFDLKEWKLDPSWVGGNYFQQWMGKSDTLPR